MKLRKSKKRLRLGEIIYIPECQALSMIVTSRGGRCTIMNSFHQGSGRIITGDISTKKFSFATKKQREIYFRYLYEHAKPAE